MTTNTDNLPDAQISPERLEWPWGEFPEDHGTWEACVAQYKALRERCELQRAWLQWCLDNCDDSPEFNFGTDATNKMRHYC